MNENAFEGISQETLDRLDKLFDSNETGGLELLGAFLALPDADFEVLRPVLQDSIMDAYKQPEVQLQMAQALAECHVSMEDLIDNIDDIVQNFSGFSETGELSESKQDFLRFMFGAMANTMAESTLNPARYVEIPVAICREKAKLPTYATNGSGAMDIYSPEEVTINPGETKIIPIGIKVAIPHGYGLLIQPRSGMSARMKVRIPNTPGLIDEDYHEEIGVIIENTDPPMKDVDVDPVSDHFDLVKLYGSSITIGEGERFAQMRLVEIPRVRWNQVSSIGEYDDDHGKGFGSSGTH